MNKFWPPICTGLCLVLASFFLNEVEAKTALENDDVAIIIGNRSYLDQDIPEVTFAHNDAFAMRLFVQNVLNIRDENIIYLENATQAQMESAFGRAGNHRGKAFQYVKPEVSNLYVFYSGHGMPGLNDQKSYLLPVDAEIETAEINGFPLDVLYENLAKVEAKSVSIFLDACFSGNSHGGPLITKASGAQIIKPNNDVTPSNGVSVLTAATNDQLASWDEENQHGLFTEYLMRAFYGAADFNDNGQINLDEIATFLKQDMRYKARRTFNREQIPTLSGNPDKIMVAAVNGAFPNRPALRENAVIDEIIEDEREEELELVQIDQEFFALKNANVRLEASTSSQKIDRLEKGEAIFVTDQVKGEPWYMVQLEEGEIGFVYQALLGEEAPPLDDEIALLKQRLKELEEENEKARLEKQKDGAQPDFQKRDNVVGPEPNWSFDVMDEVENTLKRMGGILARQSFISRTPDGEAKTAFRYNWISVDAERCALRASVSFHHDRKLFENKQNRATSIHDRQIAFNFKRELGEQKERVLKTKASNNKIINETNIYRLVPFTFSNSEDRDLFIELAEQAKTLCYQSERVSTSDMAPVQVAPSPREHFRPYKKPPPRPNFGRPPPPPPRR